MTVYTSWDEQAKWDHGIFSFRTAYVFVVGREFALWAKARNWTG